MDKGRLIALLQASCSKREYCSGQIRDKIEKMCRRGKFEGGRFLSADETEEIISLLKKEKFVDDSRFAEFYVRDKARFNKWGRVKIRLKLKQLGVEDSIINSAIEKNSLVFKTDELEDILRKKWNSLKQEESNLSKKQKVLRYALSKGFEWGEIIPVLDKLG